MQYRHGEPPYGTALRLTSKANGLLSCKAKSLLICKQQPKRQKRGLFMACASDNGQLKRSKLIPLQVSPIGHLNSQLGTRARGDAGGCTAYWCALAVLCTCPFSEWRLHERRPTPVLYRMSRKSLFFSSSSSLNIHQFYKPTKPPCKAGKKGEKPDALQNMLKVTLSKRKSPARDGWAAARRQHLKATPQACETDCDPP